MGRIKKGILGGFSGKVGTVVGANWKSISYIRSLAQNVKNPRTIGQRKQRSKFSIVVALLKQLNVILRIGWKDFAKNQSPFNAATKHTLDNAITGTYPNFVIDYKKILISRGNLTPFFTPLTAGVGGKIKLTWLDNNNVGTASRTDKLLFAAVNIDKGEVVTSFDGATRQTRSFEIPATEWVGDKVMVYFAFVSEDGKQTSTSQNIGPITITN